MRTLLKKYRGKLEPITELDESLNSLKEGETVEVTIKRKRNIKFHSKFFVMVLLFFDNQEVFCNPDYFRKEMTMSAGYFVRYKNHKGLDKFEPKSLSFSSMDQSEFEEVYNAVFNACVRNFNLENTRKEILKEIERLSP